MIMSKNMAILFPKMFNSNKINFSKIFFSLINYKKILVKDVRISIQTMKNYKHGHGHGDGRLKRSGTIWNEVKRSGTK
jgi:hypothetical protein